MLDEKKTIGEDSPTGVDKDPQEAQSPQQRPTIEIDESKALTTYANFCRVTGTPEELIIDLGLSTQPFGSTDKPIESDQRIVLNYYTAKRMLHALHLAIQRHEQIFGVLEPDIQKRVKGR